MIKETNNSTPPWAILTHKIIQFHKLKTSHNILFMFYMIMMMFLYEETKFDYTYSYSVCWNSDIKFIKKSNALMKSSRIVAVIIIFVCLSWKLGIITITVVITTNYHHQRHPHHPHQTTYSSSSSSSSSSSLQIQARS